MRFLLEIPKKDMFLKYCFTFLILAFSGINFFDDGGDLWMLANFILIVSIFIFKKIKLDEYVIIYIGIFILLFIFQSVYSKIFPFYTQIGYIIRILSGYLTVKIIGKDFPKFYVNMLVIFSLISFIFFIPIVFSPWVEHFLINNVAPIFRHYSKSSIYESNPNFIIYTVNTQRNISLFARNSGPFWEPGAFAGYLIIAIIFNIIITHKLLNYTGNILIIALITTLSTSGYLALGILIFSFFFVNYKNLLKKLILSFGFIIIFYISYTQLDFLGNKIIKDIKYSVSAPPSLLFPNRFVGAMLDIKELSDNPFLGRGLKPYNYTSDNMKWINHRTNGITHLALQFGIIAFLLYFYFVYRSFLTICILNHVKSTFVIAILTAIFIIGFSELYFSQPLFLSFAFLNFIYFESFLSNKNKIK